jgi:hypothetical protein
MAPTRRVSKVAASPLEMPPANVKEAASCIVDNRSDPRAHFALDFSAARQIFLTMPPNRGQTHRRSGRRG